MIGVERRFAFDSGSPAYIGAVAWFKYGLHGSAGVGSQCRTAARSGREAGALC